MAMPKKAHATNGTCASSKSSRIPLFAKRLGEPDFVHAKQKVASKAVVGIKPYNYLHNIHDMGPRLARRAGEDQIGSFSLNA